MRKERELSEDVAESRQEIESLQTELEDLRERLADEVAEIGARWELALQNVETFTVAPRRSDVRVEVVGVAWIPVWVTLEAGGAVR